MNYKAFIVFITLFCLSIGCYALTYVGGAVYNDAVHSRFYEGEDKDFLGKDFDWSGIGRVNGNFKWAILISEHFIISAHHFHPGTSQVIHFWPENDIDTKITAKAVWGVSMPEADIWIGMLDTSIPLDTYKRYPFYVRDFHDYNDPYIYYVGQRPLDLGGQLFALATKNISIQNSNTNILHFGYGSDHYAYAANGDSGAPSMAVVNGELAIMGGHLMVSSDGFYAQHTDRINEIIASAPNHNTERVKIATVDPVELHITDELEVEWINTGGVIYELETSDELQTWDSWMTVTGGVNKGWSAELYEFYNLKNKFFRLKYTP